MTLTICTSSKAPEAVFAMVAFSAGALSRGNTAMSKEAALRIIAAILCGSIIRSKIATVQFGIVLQC